jgi:hypothetical protein
VGACRAEAQSAKAGACRAEAQSAKAGRKTCAFSITRMTPLLHRRVTIEPKT